MVIKYSNMEYPNIYTEYKNKALYLKLLYPLKRAINSLIEEQILFFVDALSNYIHLKFCQIVPLITRLNLHISCSVATK